MGTKKRNPATLLQRIQRAARAHGVEIAESPRRGKGSHQLFLLYDQDGRQLDQFVLTGHNRDISSLVLRDLEKRLAPLFGEKWAEER